MYNAIGKSLHEANFPILVVFMPPLTLGSTDGLRSRHVISD